MRERKRTPLAAALVLLALSAHAAAQERVTLRIADQKGGMRSQLEAANALQNLNYDIKWAEFPAAAPLAEALNAGAVDAGIIGDAPLLFALANGAPVKAIAVDKSNPAGTAVLVPPGSPLKSAADLKGKRIATGKGSIGHFVALKALEQAGISPKDVQWVFLGPVDAKVALLNGSVDAWATWEPYTTQLVKTAEGQILVSARGCCPEIPSLRPPTPALRIRLNGRRCRTICIAWRAPSAGPMPIWTATAKPSGRSFVSRRRSPGRSSLTGNRSGSAWTRGSSPSSRPPPIFIRPTG
ncbi:Putative aliphatic sulfonates-binding protein precursor [Raoultella terrigena]|uniref:Putative aliphatic sulfonates-binding protein n=1 Tax=Raoultella terrigena TaxID=577 RepID=A0A4U9CWB7_RAOTE|nr:Putative aliphatic sulfonates-binding protein precursor [Raoultella terrigena]